MPHLAFQKLARNGMVSHQAQEQDAASAADYDDRLSSSRLDRYFRGFFRDLAVRFGQDSEC